MAFFFAPYRIRGLPGHGVRDRARPRGLLGLAPVAARSFGVLHCSRRSTLHVPRRADDLAVFHGGFLLVDLATLFVIAAVVHPALRRRAASSAGGRCGGSACAPTASTCGTTRSSASPGPGSTSTDFFHLHGLAGLRCCASCSSFAAAELSYRFVETPIRNGAIAATESGSARRTASRSNDCCAAARSSAVRSCSLAAMLGTGLAAAQPAEDRRGATGPGQER